MHAAKEKARKEEEERKKEEEERKRMEETMQRIKVLQENGMQDADDHELLLFNRILRKNGGDKDAHQAVQTELNKRLRGMGRGRRGMFDDERFGGRYGGDRFRGGFDDGPFRGGRGHRRDGDSEDDFDDMELAFMHMRRAGRRDSDSF